MEEETTSVPASSSDNITSNGLGEDMVDWLMDNSVNIELGAGFAVTALAFGVLMKLLWKCNDKCYFCILPRFITVFTSIRLVEYACTRGLSLIEIALLTFCAGEIFDDYSIPHPHKEKYRFKILLLPTAYILHVINNEHWVYNIVWSYSEYLEVLIASQLIIQDRKRYIDKSSYYHCVISAMIKLFALSPHLCQFYDSCLRSNYFSRKKFFNRMTNHIFYAIISVIIYLWRRGQPTWRNTKEEDEAEKKKANESVKNNEGRSGTDDEKDSNGSDWEIIDGVNADDDDTAEKIEMKHCEKTVNKAGIEKITTALRHLKSTFAKKELKK